MSKKLFVIIVNIVLLVSLSACSWLDSTIGGAMDKGFGNDKSCSGLVC